MKRGRPRIHEWWITRILEEHENDRTLKAPGILAKLESAINSESVLVPPGVKDEPPDVRTVRRVMNEVAPALSDDQRERYRYVRWPESMEQGLLPWEASQAALTLVRWWKQFGGSRPTVNTALWFWRIGLAAPDLDVGVRAIISGTIDTIEKAADADQRKWRDLELLRNALEGVLIERQPLPEELRPPINEILDQILGDIGDSHGRKHQGKKKGKQ